MHPIDFVFFAFVAVGTVFVAFPFGLGLILVVRSLGGVVVVCSFQFFDLFFMVGIVYFQLGDLFVHVGLFFLAFL